MDGATSATSEDGAAEPADVTVISPTGDLVLAVSDEHSTEQHLYRVDTKQLSQSSAYFANLLGGRFNEAADVSSRLHALKLSHERMADVPAAELPRVRVVDIGRTSRLGSVGPVTADFLLALHGLDVSTAHPPLPNLANLAVVADRFDALPAFAERVRRRKYFQAIDGRLRGAKAVSSEERIRQRLMLGVMLDYAPWVAACSKRLIMTDSRCWNAHEVGDDREALWWDLPSGVEEELMYRRECVLDTINSLQAHFLKLYTAGERQCKLGYDTSLQCDSFQLGEMVRFFTRIGTLRLQGTLLDTEESTPYSGDIQKLLDSFRQCSSYQVDENHKHCGLRTRFIPLLDTLQSYLRLDAKNTELGICGDCWRDHRSEYRWSGAKRPLTWSVSSLRMREIPPRGVPGENSCLARHVAFRDMFTAVQRDWTPHERSTDTINGFNHSSTPTMKNFRF